MTTAMACGIKRSIDETLILNGVMSGCERNCLR
jgi:hypothetical protein